MNCILKTEFKMKVNKEELVTFTIRGMHQLKKTLQEAQAHPLVFIVVVQFQ